MAYNALNNLIDAYIYANGVQAITGQILNGVLKQMVSQLGSGYHLMGVAGPETVPASNDYAMAYFAATAGEYTDFGGITLAAGEVAVLLTSGNGSWSKQTVYNVPTGTADLENTANFITNAVTDLVNYYTKTEVDDTLANYPTLEALATALADYYTKQEIDGQKAETDAALADRYTKSETDTKLEDYYKKVETYDKNEVDSIVAALSRQEYIVAWDGLAAPDVSAIPAGVTVTYSGTPYTGTLAASASTVNKIYMVWNGVAYDMYGTSQDGGYSWVPMGTTSVDLSQYATKAEVSQLQQEVTADISQLEAKVNDIYSDKSIPDVFTFPGVGGAISFDPITLSEEGDAFDIDIENETGASTATKGMAFATRNGARAIEVTDAVVGVMNSNGSWLSGMDGGNGQRNIYVNNNVRIWGGKQNLKFIVASGNLELWLEGVKLHTEPLNSGTIQIDKIGGPYSSSYWKGKIHGFRYIHNGATTEIYNLPGFAVSGDVTYTTKRVVSGVLEDTIEAVNDLDERVDEAENGLATLEGKTFGEKEATTTIDVSDIPGVVKMAGYNAGPNRKTEVLFSALSGYDSYYFYPSSALSAWLTDPGVSYIAISIVENAQPFNINAIQGTSAYRKRKSDSNLPSESSPLSIPEGAAVIVTVSAGQVVDFATKSNINTFNGNTPLAEEHIEQVLDAIEGDKEGEPMYVTKKAEKLDIYLRIPNGKYIRYPFVKRYKAYTDGEYPSFYDNWGIGVPALAVFSGSMTDVAPLFLSGEAELAISVPSGSDGETPTYVGGQAHGFENIVTGSNGREICILVDNQKVAEDAVLSLTPASKVDIIQHTQICQAYTNTNPFADVTKHWVWENGKMSCTTSVKVLRSILFRYAQFGMMCVYRRWLGDVNNDYLTNSAIKNDNPFKVWDVSDGWSGMLQSPDKDCTRIVEYGQKGLGFSMSIKSETIKSNGGMFVATNGLAYNKIYFDMGRSFTPSVDDVLEGTQTWEILG